MNRVTLALLPLLALVACSGAAGGNASNAATAQGAATLPLTITSKGKIHRFDVEAALTPAQQEKGLMFRKAVPANGGMIFPMDPPRIASFWMKDTAVPLDMLFIRTDGSIAMVAANTIAESRVPVSAGIPVAGVLELRGGRAAELGIAQDDMVQWGACAIGKGKPDVSSDARNFCPTTR